VEVSVGIATMAKNSTAKRKRKSRANLSQEQHEEEFWTTLTAGSEPVRGLPDQWLPVNVQSFYLAKIRINKI